MRAMIAIQVVFLAAMVTVSAAVNGVSSLGEEHPLEGALWLGMCTLAVIAAAFYARQIRSGR